MKQGRVRYVSMPSRCMTTALTESILPLGPSCPVTANVVPLLGIEWTWRCIRSRSDNGPGVGGRWTRCEGVDDIARRYRRAQINLTSFEFEDNRNLISNSSHIFSLQYPRSSLHPPWLSDPSPSSNHNAGGSAPAGICSSSTGRIGIYTSITFTFGRHHSTC